jgi:hypothetical protein
MRKFLFLGLLAVSMLSLNSCQKEDLLGDELMSSSKTTNGSSATLTSTDDRHGRPRPTPIDVSELPTTVTDYVTANYADGTIEHAGTLQNGNYVVMVENADGTKVGLMFDSTGAFVQELPPPPAGGPGGCGLGGHPTSVDVSTLPATITDYVTANYADGTIEHAGTLQNGNYVVMVENADGTKVGLMFDSTGAFVQELPPPPAGGPGGGGPGGGNHPHPTPIDISALPSSVSSYVTANYAGYTIQRAGTLPDGSYVIFIKNADGSKVGLLFDASGNFVQQLPPPPFGG